MCAHEHLDAIDLLLTDVTLSGISGRELARKIGDVRSTIKTLFVSCYTPDLTKRFAPFEPGALLNKPFTRQSLLGAVSAF